MSGGSEPAKWCKLRLVDRAGSERQKRTKATGECLKEGVIYNSSSVHSWHSLLVICGKPTHIEKRKTQKAKRAHMHTTHSTQHTGTGVQVLNAICRYQRAVSIVHVCSMQRTQTETQSTRHLNTKCACSHYTNTLTLTPTHAHMQAPCMSYC